MIGIGYELGSSTPTQDNPFGLRPPLLEHSNREVFWEGLRGLVSKGEVDTVVFHRFYGEARARDYFDFDARRQIERSNDSKYTDYAKHMTRELIRFAHENPSIRIDIYYGSLRQFNMAFLLSDGQTEEWTSRFWYEIETARDLIEDGCDIRMVFDHASSYDPARPEWFALYQLSRMYPNRVVIESLPKPGTPQAALPGWCFEDNYEWIASSDPERASHFDVTRMTHGTPTNGVVAFVRDCLDKGHTPIVADTQFNRIKMTPSQVLAEAQIDRPVGTNE